MTRFSGALCLSLCLLLIPAAMVTPTAFAAQHLEGITAKGAIYAFDVPDHWSGGDLILYAHGIIDPARPIAAPTDQDNFGLIRDRWLDLGYAVASSSYSENGYALKDGAERTHQLRALFISKFGRPHRVYLAGHSLGGVVAEMLAERYPEQYDGAFLMCAFLGGGIPEADYYAHGRVLFDYFFPGVAPGDLFHIPAGLDYSETSPTFQAVLNAVLYGFVAPGQPTLQYASVAHLPGIAPEEIVASALTVIGFDVRFVNDILARTHGHIPFDNTTTHYTGSLDDAALNAGVQRFASDPDAVRYLETYYAPTGNLRIPTVTLHTTRDPVNPFFHEALYAEVVAGAGASDFLLQESIDRYGHCAMTVDETITAFADLRSWVETGVKPEPGGEPIP